MALGSDPPLYVKVVPLSLEVQLLTKLSLWLRSDRGPRVFHLVERDDFSKSCLSQLRDTTFGNVVPLVESHHPDPEFLTKLRGTTFEKVVALCSDVQL